MAIDEGTAFARLVLALRPYLADLVFIGGWAHRLFRLHPLSQRLDFVPLLTQDVDLAVRGGLAARERDLRELLLKAGFTERFLGEDRPPITHYQLGDHEPFYVEFLTPRIGGPARRNGTSNATEDVAGVTARRLRHLDVLLVAPWSVLVEPSDFPIGPKVLEVRIANATSYISQKLLVLLNRRPPDRAKDVLSIFTTRS